MYHNSIAGFFSRKLSGKIFSQNRWIGTGKLVISHAFYDTDGYQKILKETFGELSTFASHFCLTVVC